MSKLVNYLQLMRFDKPIGTLLLLWPTLIGLWLAGNGSPDFAVVTVFVAGVIVMRAAGCVINDYADRNLDKHVARTKNRPITSGRVSSKEALILFAFLIACAFFLVLQLNLLTILLSVGALLLASSYPFVKRYSNYPQVVLGAAFGWAIPMSYSALNNSVTLEAFWVFIAMLCWTVAYDTQYAMVDKDDDLKVGIKSTAIAFGDYDKTIILLLQFTCLLMLALVANWNSLGVMFYCGLLIALALTIYQQYLIRSRSKPQCFQAFLNNNYFGMVLFLGLLLDSYI